MDVMYARDVVLDVLFPRRRCLACDGTENVQQGICAPCRETMQQIGPAVCSICGHPEEERETCAICRVHRPPYEAARAVFYYESAVRECLHKMKYGGEYDQPARLFAREMARVVTEERWSVDLVTCVPSTSRTYRQRGYNQAEVLARRVAHHLHLNLVPRLLSKRRGTRSQVGLDPDERRANALGSILPGGEAKRCMDKVVLLVDDVMTTGSTVEACTSALLGRGAKAVYVICAARAPGTNKK